MGIRIEGEDDNDDVVETTQAVTGEHELSDAELDAETDESNGETGEDETTVVSIGDPPADTSAATEDHQNAAPQWAKDLRKDHRRLQRELAEERRKNAAVQAVQQPEAGPTLGPEPTLESCGWDEAEFRKQTAAHIKQASEIEARKERQAEEIRSQQRTAQERHKTYKAQAGALKVTDFEDAEDAVVDTLSEVQQNILLAGADNAALIVYALGKNPDKARELAKITDPVKFAFAAAKLEKDVKVTPRKNTKPAPETVHRSSASLTGGGSTALAAARKRAEDTGDYTEVNRIRRAERAAAKRK